MLKVLPNDVGERELRYFLGYDTKWKNNIYVEGTFMSNDRLDTWVVTVWYCLLEKEEPGGHCPKRYAQKDRRMLGPAMSQ